MLEIRESQIEDIFATHLEEAKTILSLTENLTLMDRQRSLNSGRIDLLFISASSLHLVELKAVTCKKEFCDQTIGYRDDLLQLQLEHKIPALPLKSYLVCPKIGKIDKAYCFEKEIIPIEFSPYELLKNYYFKVKAISNLMLIKPSNHGLWNLHLFNPLLYAVDEKTNLINLSKITGKSKSTVGSYLRLASELGLTNKDFNVSLTDLGKKYVSLKDERITRLNDNQVDLLKDYILKNPFSSPAVYGIYAAVETVFLLSKNYYPVPLNSAHSFFTILSGKQSEWVKPPEYFHIDFWFSKPVLQHLSILHHFLSQISEEDIQRLFFIAFSETLRECSYTRNNEFKLYRMKSEDVLKFNPDVLGVYFDRLNKVLDVYEYCYLPKLEKVQVSITYKQFPKQENYFDAVLTSPPYGDSKTTVAYGQFSQFSNEWLGIDYARQIDGLLMGGKHQKKNYTNGILSDYIREVEQQDSKRALEVSAFYFDLEKSIHDVAHSVKPGGKVIYVVGNRRVKGIQLPTDQFIAEKFCQNGFGHLTTYERQISNKVMPSKNSPSNKTGVTLDTMTQEFIVICEKNK